MRNPSHPLKAWPWPRLDRAHTARTGPRRVRDERGSFAMTQYMAMALGISLILTLGIFVSHSLGANQHLLATGSNFSASTNYIDRAEQDIAAASALVRGAPDDLVLDEQSIDDKGLTHHTFVRYALTTRTVPAGTVPSDKTATSQHVMTRQVCTDCPAPYADALWTAPAQASQVATSYAAYNWNPATHPFAYGDGKGTSGAPSDVDATLTLNAVKIVYLTYDATTDGADQQATGAQSLTHLGVGTTAIVAPPTPNQPPVATHDIYDTFTGTAGSPLGVTEDPGHETWMDLASTSGAPADTWTRGDGSQGYAKTTRASGENPAAVVDAGSGDIDIQVTPESTDQAGPDGEAAYARYTDPDDWLRLRETEQTNAHQATIYYDTYTPIYEWTKTTTTYVSSVTTSTYKVHQWTWHFAALRMAKKVLQAGSNPPKYCWPGVEVPLKGSNVLIDAGPGGNGFLVPWGINYYDKDAGSCDGDASPPEGYAYSFSSGNQPATARVAVPGANYGAQWALGWDPEQGDIESKGIIGHAPGRPNFTNPQPGGPQDGNTYTDTGPRHANDTLVPGTTVTTTNPAVCEQYETDQAGETVYDKNGNPVCQTWDNNTTAETSTQTTDSATSPGAGWVQGDQVDSQVCSNCGSYTYTYYTYDWTAHLEKDVNGTITALGTYALGSGLPPVIGLDTHGSTVKALASGQVIGTVTDPFNANATLCGVGYGTGSSASGTGIDAVYIKASTG